MTNGDDDDDDDDDDDVQATQGDCTTPRPGMFDPVSRAKVRVVRCSAGGARMKEGRAGATERRAVSPLESLSRDSHPHF